MLTGKTMPILTMPKTVESQFGYKPKFHKSATAASYKFSVICAIDGQKLIDKPKNVYSAKVGEALLLKQYYSQ